MKLKECNIGQIVRENITGTTRTDQRTGHIVGLTYRYCLATIVNQADCTMSSISDDVIPLVLWCGETIPQGVSEENLSKLK